MHHALLLVAAALARAHDIWLLRVGRRRSLAGRVAVLEQRIARLEAEGALLRARFLRLPIPPAPSSARIS